MKSSQKNFGSETRKKRSRKYLVSESRVHQIQAVNEFRAKRTAYRENYIGSRPPESGSWQTWARSTNETAVPIMYTLQDVSLCRCDQIGRIFKSSQQQFFLQKQAKIFADFLATFKNRKILTLAIFVTIWATFNLSNQSPWTLVIKVIGNKFAFLETTAKENL